MISIKNLKFKVKEKEIISGLSLDFEEGKNYLLLGRNGSGKSSLTGFLMGNPVFEYDSGEVQIDGKDLLKMDVTERSQSGIFLSFQNVPEIPGINLSEYLRIIYNNKQKSVNPEFKEISPFIFKRFLKKYLEILNISETFLSRDLNVGFSGGEKRKIELLQILLLEPKYIIFDEIDSGLDIEAYKVVADTMKKINNSKNSLIVITHNFEIQNELEFDKVFVLKDGVLDREGDISLVREIKEKGF